MWLFVLLSRQRKLVHTSIIKYGFVGVLTLLYLNFITFQTYFFITSRVPYCFRNRIASLRVLSGSQSSSFSQWLFWGSRTNWIMSKYKSSFSDHIVLKVDCFRIPTSDYYYYDLLINNILLLNKFSLSIFIIKYMLYLIQNLAKSYIKFSYNK